MIECDFCRKEVDKIYRCTSCGGYFCREHRLPESHDCPEYFRESRAREAAAYALHRIFLTESHQDSGGTNFGKLFSFSGRELNHLTICILIMAIMPIVSFGITFSRNPILLIVAVTIFLAAFLFHEMGHKFSAQLMGYWAEFRLNGVGLFITLMSLFSPIKLVAPGAVMIAGRIDSDEFGKIALSGPLTNIAQAVIYLLLDITATNSDIGILASIGYTINLSLALFNLLPFGVFDGAKIMHWDKRIWLVTFMTAGLLFLISFI